MSFNISEYIKILKKYALNQSVSNEEFINGLFEPYIYAANIKNKKGETYHFDKSKTSQLLSGQDNLTEIFRENLSRCDIIESTRSEFETFLNDYINADHLKSAVEEINSTIQADTLIADETKRRLRELSGDSKDFLLNAFFEAVKIVMPIPKSESILIWQRGNSTISLDCDNLMAKGFPRNAPKRELIIIIPVNTSFETEITDLTKTGLTLVSSNTLHGMWIKEMNDKGIDKKKLDDMINQSLIISGIVPTHKSASSEGKQECYPIGTVATVRYKNVSFYLLAISEFDNMNRAQSTADDIEKALSAMLDYYDTYGQGVDLYIPLVGTGRSRAKFTNQQSFDLIKNTLLDNQGKIQGNVHIVVLQSAMQEINTYQEDNKNV